VLTPGSASSGTSGSGMGDGSAHVLQVAEGASGMTSRDRHARLRAEA
jgi:hypothetical protein